MAIRLSILRAGRAPLPREVSTGCGKLASFFHIALKNSSKDIFSIFFITKGTFEIVVYIVLKIVSGK
jgi:hypothetical protein